MASEQFSQAVRGSNGEPVATNATGTLETNDYPNGDAVQVDPSDGDSYPVTVNPAETIHEIVLLSAPDVDLEVTTTEGDNFSLRLDGASGTLDRWKVDEFTIRDPRGTGALFSGGWAGE